MTPAAAALVTHEHAAAAASLLRLARALEAALQPCVQSTEAAAGLRQIGAEGQCCVQQLQQLMPAVSATQRRRRQRRAATRRAHEGATKNGIADIALQQVNRGIEASRHRGIEPSSLRLQAA